MPAQRRKKDLVSWLQTFQRAPSAQIKLICFSYAGGATRVYQGWGALLGPQVEVGVVVLPGREHRYGEVPPTRLDELIPALAEGLSEHLQQPFAFYGHSLGALLVHELSCYLRRQGRTGPARLLVSGRPPPQFAFRGPRLHDLPDDRFVAEVQRHYGGIPPVIFRERDLMALMIPRLRADLTLVENYVYRPEPPLACPIHAMTGSSDPLATEAEVAGWAERTSAAFDLAVFPGGHFFLHDAPPPLLAHVRSRLLG